MASWTVSFPGGGLDFDLRFRRTWTSQHFGSIPGSVPPLFRFLFLTVRVPIVRVGLVSVLSLVPFLFLGHTC